MREQPVGLGRALRQRDQRAVGEVELDALAAAGCAAAQEDGARGRARAASRRRPGPYDAASSFFRGVAVRLAGARLRLRLRLRLRRLLAEAAQAALEVVEDEADGGLGGGRRGDQPVARRGRRRRCRRGARHRAARAPGSPASPPRGRARAPSRRCGPRARRRRSRRDGALAVEDDRGLDLRRDLGQVGERIGGLRHAA